MPATWGTDACENNWNFTEAPVRTSGVSGEHLPSWVAGGLEDSSVGPESAGQAPRWPVGSAPRVLWAAKRRRLR